MKQLIIVRHAKSSWALPAMEDIDRPLNERGKNDAPLMAKRLSDRKVKIDAFISSPAKRARKTAKLFAKTLNLKKDDIQLSEDLYMAGENDFYKVISNARNKYDSIALFSHNPGITDFVNSLTNVRIDNMPTCAVFAIRADIDKWSDFGKGKKEFWFFDYPRASY